MVFLDYFKNNWDILLLLTPLPYQGTNKIQFSTRNIFFDLKISALFLQTHTHYSIINIFFQSINNNINDNLITFLAHMLLYKISQIVCVRD